MAHVRTSGRAWIVLVRTPFRARFARARVHRRRRSTERGCMRWGREEVAARIREAWDTLRRVPAQSVPGFRVSWPDMVQDTFDAYGYTQATVRLARASPASIDRMHETFGWFVHLAGEPHLTKAVWLCAGAGMGPKRAGAILGVHRDTLRARRDAGLDRIAEALNRDAMRAA
jgi:hypothetical protein